MRTIQRIARTGRNRLFLYAAAAMLAGCANTAPRYTKQDIDAVKAACTRQSETDRQAKVSNWFTRWLDCQNERVMPIEIEMNRTIESEIRRFYARASELAPKVDSGEMSLHEYNAKVQELKEELFDVRCLLSVAQQDGGERCINYQRVKWR